MYDDSTRDMFLKKILIRIIIIIMLISCLYLYLFVCKNVSVVGST